MASPKYRTIRDFPGFIKTGLCFGDYGLDYDITKAVEAPGVHDLLLSIEDKRQIMVMDDTGPAFKLGNHLLEYELTKRIEAQGVQLDEIYPPYIQKVFTSSEFVGTQEAVTNTMALLRLKSLLEVAIQRDLIDPSISFVEWAEAYHNSAVPFEVFKYFLTDSSLQHVDEPTEIPYEDLDQNTRELLKLISMSMDGIDNLPPYFYGPGDTFWCDKGQLLVDMFIGDTDDADKLNFEDFKIVCYGLFGDTAFKEFTQMCETQSELVQSEAASP